MGTWKKKVQRRKRYGCTERKASEDSHQTPVRTRQGKRQALADEARDMTWAQGWVGGTDFSPAERPCLAL